MGIGRFSPRSLGAWAYLAFAVVILVRSFIPTGYMLGPAGEDGRFVVTICHDDVVQQMVMNPDTGDLTPLDETTEDDNASRGGSCPFALSAIYNVPLLGTEVAPSIAADYQATPIRHDQTHHDAAARPPLPARGPPHLL